MKKIHFLEDTDAKTIFGATEFLSWKIIKTNTLRHSNNKQSESILISREFKENINSEGLKK